MTDPMTGADLDAIEKRTNAATEGPWEYDEFPRHPGTWGIWGVRPDDEIGDRTVLVAEGRIYERDAEFIAHAHADVPTLLADVRRLRARVAQWQEWADNLTPRCCCGNCEDR